MSVSIFGSMVAKFQSLDGVPTLYTYDIPVSVGGVQVLPPYAVMLDEGGSPQYEFEHSIMEVVNVTIMVYANDPDVVAQYAERIKYNGGTTTQGSGLDFGTLPALTIPYTNLVIMRTNEQSFEAKPTGESAERLFGVRLTYQVTVYRV